MPTVGAWELSDITTTGPDPFSNVSSGNSGSIGVSTISVAAPGALTLVDITDTDATLSDGETDAALTNASVFNGVAFAAGQRVEVEYTYLIRPVGSTDPADAFEIHSVEFDPSGLHAILAAQRLEPGVTYEFVSIVDNSPDVLYSSLFVCFATGTKIATPSGARRVETLRAGDLVTTADAGAQMIKWHAARQVRLGPPARASQHPVRIAAGSLPCGGPDADLIVSPQHRIMLSGPVVAALCGVPQVLVPARALTGLKGVRRLCGWRSAVYHTLLLERHHILRAEGAAAESLYPGPAALAMMGADLQAEVQQVLGSIKAATGRGYGPPARLCLTARNASRLVEALQLAAAAPKLCLSDLRPAI